jgi:hypothetical protein
MLSFRISRRLGTLADRVFESRKIPWNSEDILEGVKTEPTRLKDYLRKVVKTLNDIYEDLATAHNNLVDSITEFIYTPDSLTVSTGTVNSGDVDSVKVLSDGDVLDVQEVAGVPGFDIIFDFINVGTINQLRYHTRYDGGAGHTVNVQLYNYNTSAWDTLTTEAESLDYIYSAIPVTSSSDYVDSSGNARARLYHVDAGIAAHQQYVDFIALAQAGFGGATDHGSLSNLDNDDHTQYFLADGSRSLSGDLTFSGTGRRITGDMSNATLGNRLAFQTTTSNSSTNLGIIPGGTSAVSSLQLYNSSGLSNCNAGQLYVYADAFRIETADIGSPAGSIPIVLRIAGTEIMRITTGGDLQFAGTGRRITGDMGNATHANRLSFQTSTTNGNTMPFILPNGTGTISGIVAASASNPANCSFLQLAIIDSTDARLVSSIIGTGTLLPFTFHVGSERMRIGKDYGNVSIGYAAEPSDKRLTVLSQGTTSSYYDLWTGTSGGTNNFFSRSDGVVYARVGYGTAGVIATNVNFYSRSSTSTSGSYACIWQNSSGSNLMYVNGAWSGMDSHGMDSECQKH